MVGWWEVTPPRYQLKRLVVGIFCGMFFREKILVGSSKGRTMLLLLLSYCMEW